MKINHFLVCVLKNAHLNMKHPACLPPNEVFIAKKIKGLQKKTYYIVLLEDMMFYTCPDKKSKSIERESSVTQRNQHG